MSSSSSESTAKARQIKIGMRRSERFGAVLKSPK